MAQVTFTAVNEGDALNAATWNTLFTNLSTASTSVDTNNIRQEGIDKRNIKSNSILTNHLRTENTSTVAVSYGDAAANVDFTVGWVSLAPTLRVGPFSLSPTTQFAILRVSIEVRRFAGYRRATSINLRPEYGFSLFQSVGGVVTQIPYVLWSLSTHIQSTARDPLNLRNTYSPMWAHAIVVGAATTFDWIELRVTGLGAAANYANALEWLYLSEGSIQVSVWDR